VIAYRLPDPVRGLVHCARRAIFVVRLPRMGASVVARSLCVVVATAAVLGGCASSPPPRVEHEAPAADPDHLLALALRAWAVDKDSPHALSLAERAAAAAPARPDVAWLHLRLCAQTPACQPQSLEARLKKLAPENAAVWLSVLSRAQAGKDLQVEQQVLTAMSRSQAFNLYWTPLVWRIATALNRDPPPRNDKDAAAPLTSALNETAGWLSAIVTPSFRPLTAACSVEKAREAARRALCLDTAKVLQRSDTYIAEGLGLGIAQRLATPGSTQAAQIEERIEVIGYQNQAAGAVMTAQVEREKFSAEVVELLKKLPREQDVSLAILRWAQQPLTP
jgi:hypothetical protein